MISIVRPLAVVTLALGLAGAALPVLAQQPSLAEIARQESERRKAADKAGKQYTNDDVKQGRPLTTSGKAAAAPAAEPGPAADAKDTKAEKPARPASKAAAEAAVKRVLDMKEQASRNRLEAERVQARVNELNLGVINSFDQAEREKLIRLRDEALGNYRKLQEESAYLTRTAEELEAELRKGGTAAPEKKQ